MKESIAKHAIMSKLEGHPKTLRIPQIASMYWTSDTYLNDVSYWRTIRADIILLSNIDILSRHENPIDGRRLDTDFITRVEVICVMRE